MPGRRWTLRRVAVGQPFRGWSASGDSGPERESCRLVVDRGPRGRAWRSPPDALRRPLVRGPTVQRHSGRWAIGRRRPRVPGGGFNDTSRTASSSLDRAIQERSGALRTVTQRDPSRGRRRGHGRRIDRGAPRGTRYVAHRCRRPDGSSRRLSSCWRATSAGGCSNAGNGVRTPDPCRCP